MSDNEEFDEEQESFKGIIKYEIEIKIEGEEPKIEILKKIIEDGLFDKCNGFHRVTKLNSDKELEDIIKNMEAEDNVSSQ